MSSEGSVSSSGSRIRQFGLYRTIDARTEEFLRSSRKRQIRQGCACAAISTAITVTVVVSVILVYEYSVNSGINFNKKGSLKPNWIGLMNDSDITSISSKFNKKINFDRTTLKLLPILLKALNKNRYLEKILEEYSSSSPPYRGKEVTEATFTKNVFSSSNNWLKKLTTKHYTPEYKTSPLINWKSPTKRLEYLTKIRKIRDYQRMLNYFDKMINDKVGINQKKEFEYTENPFTAETVPMTKIDKIKSIQHMGLTLQNNIHNNEIKTEDAEGIVVCNCPKKLGLLIGKLITALQDLIPQVLGNKIGSVICKNKTKSLNKVTTARTVRPTRRRINDFLTTLAMSSIRKATKKTPKVAITSSKCCTASTTTRGTIKSSDTTSRTTSTVTKTTPTTNATTAATKTSTYPTNIEFDMKSFEDSIIQLPTEISVKMPTTLSLEKTSTNYDLHTKPTESLSTQTTEMPKVKRRTTEKIVPIKFITDSSSEKWLNTIGSSFSNMNVPIYKEEEYDDYFNNKPSKTTNEFENIDVHSIQPLKTKTTSFGEDFGLDNDKNLKEMVGNVKLLSENPDAIQKDLDLTSMRKLANMVYVPQEKNAKVWKYTIDPELPVPSHRKYKNSEFQTNFIFTNSVENSVDPTASNIVTSSQKNLVGIDTTTDDLKDDHYVSTNKYESQSHSTYLHTNDNIDNDEFQDEYSRPTESTRAPYKYKNTTKKVDTTIENLKQTSPWELLKNQEKILTEPTKSMLPSLRPIYLEIQRNNEWRQDEHGDYDIYNFNNNIFDLPNTNE